MKKILAGSIMCALMAFPFYGTQAMGKEKGASTKGNNEKTLRIKAGAGLGYDSNVYLAHDGSYVDLAQTGSPLVTPEIQSGFFIPANLKGKYRNPLTSRRDFLLSFRSRGNFYLDSNKDNANDYDNKLKLGINFITRQVKKEEDTLYAGGFAGYHKELYIDRDTGLDKTSSITFTDISNRYTYFSYGVEGDYERETGRFKYGVGGKVEKRNYENPVVVSKLDHLYYALLAKVKIRISGPLKLKGFYKYSVRDYDERPSRDSNGTLLSTNPTRNYSYHTLGTTLRGRVSSTLVAYLDYKLTLRKDDFQGYDDYTKNKIGVRAIYDDGDRFRSRLSLSYWNRNYDKAFAFDNPAGGKKDYDGYRIKGKGEYSFHENWSAWVEGKYQVEDSTDLRYDYDRYQAMAGVQWKY